MSTNLAEYIFYGLILIVSGLAEYLKLAPAGTFLPVLTLVVGHFLGTAGLGTAGKIVNFANSLNAGTATTPTATETVTSPKSTGGQ